MPENFGFDCELDNVNGENSKDLTRKLSGNVRNYSTIISDQQDTDIRSECWCMRKSRQQYGCSNNLLVIIIGVIIQVGLVWSLLYCLFGDQVTFNGGLFKLLSLAITSYVAGQLVALIKLPPLLGMLITGIVFKTSGFYSISHPYDEIVIVLRELSLCTILIRAGLGLDADALLKLSFAVLRLAILPCVGESIGIAIASHYIIGFPWLWGILLGFLLSAVSPAVVVPALLNLKEKGYGEDKGIATLVIAASSVDDITAISVFGVVLGMIFSQGNLTDQLLQGPKELLLGLVTGISWGFLSSLFPNVNDNVLIFKRSIMIGVWGLLAVIGSEKIGCPGAGPLSCIVASLTAGIFWKMQGWTDQNPVSDIFCVCWRIMQPILFGLIGAEIDLTQLRIEAISLGVLTIICGLGFRVITCFIALLGTNLNIKEKLFVNLAWIPKATVQAALASKALDVVHAQQSPRSSDEYLATEVLTVAVLSILITAPLGAIGVAIGGPIFLSNNNQQKPDKNDGTV